jgi:hypothetical protein
MSIPAEAVPVALALARLGIDIAEGKVNSVGDAARSLVGLGLQLVPREELHRYLTTFGRESAEIAADIAEVAKFGFPTDPLDEEDEDAP